MGDARSGETLRIADLIGTDGNLSDTPFVDCHLYGPAVLYAETPEDILLTGNMESDAGSPDALYWVIPEERESFRGAVHVSRCSFHNCSFHNIGIAGRPSTIDHLRKGTRLLGPPEGNGHR